ncbi:hypothetical protein TEA_019760 [Camellia sinensis var. sinensis]|uniref:Protein kinase domain-containing protein n=1 Tax=Camellia sinensis var. sinensis TaxID=542762 RepID=A0A4S4EGW8_CAMSN|nr:hypothetical protein TEA_019760 [Camellia sinensis var. sinensis]
MAYLHIGRSVFDMNFTELGNLVLFNQNNATVWQLFDHPTDSLLVGQTLFPFQKLTSSTSSSNLTPVLYSLTVQADNTLVAYVESHLSLPYFRSYSNVEYVKLENESLLGQKIPIASSSSPQFIRLNLDGHLKAYEWGRSNWNTVAHLMTSDIGDCCYPMVCGNYGICSSNGQCSCPEEAIGNSTFRQINHTQPSLGCEYCNAKISDFGLSKLIDKDQSQVVTTLTGTPSYLAPEWLNSIITEKLDVYSFGVVVLEILCGRKNLDRCQPEEDMHLLKVVEMMRVAVWCLQSDFSKRPSMLVVVKVLEGSVDVESNLDYNVINPVIPRSIAAAGQQEHATGAATTLLFPSALSGSS